MASSVRNTAIKRIQGDVREMMKDPSDQYCAAPLEDNMFDWHFTLRGPRDTEFEGGIYHGRILLPADYPFKPPNIMLLTPNGRFEVRKKICLSISAFHPEEWQPAWGIRLILEALISFMPTKGEGAIGALDYPPQERRRLAKLSAEFKCDVCGCAAELLPELKTDDVEEDSKPSKYADQIAQLHMHSLETGGATPSPSPSEDTKPAAADSSQQDAAPDSSEPSKVVESAGSVDTSDVIDTNESQSEAVTAEPNAPNVERAAAIPEPLEQRDAPPIIPPVRVQARARAPVARAPVETHGPDVIDTVLHYVAVALAVALFALVYKRLLQMQGVLQ